MKELLEECRKNKLSPNQYVYLFYLYYKIAKEFPISIREMNGLEDEGYIKCEEDDTIIVRSKTNKLFEVATDYSKFLEFWGTYPIKVNDNRGGYRVLRTKDENSRQAKDVKAKYAKYLKQHDKVMKGLLGYLHNMKNKMQYIVGIEVFLNQAMFEKYLDEDVEESTNEIKL
jgi:hypothetical protein